MSESGTPLRSPARDYQVRHASLGLCTHCAAPKLQGRDRCFRHTVHYFLAKYGLTKGRLGKIEFNRREKLSSFLAGRHAAIVGGFLEPADMEQSMKESADLRLRLNIKWSGLQGVAKLARVIRKMDRNAMRQREAKNG